MPKYIIELPIRGWVQETFTASSPVEAVQDFIDSCTVDDELRLVSNHNLSPNEQGNYDGWLELCIRVSPAQEEE